MNALLLAAGKATRLGTLSERTPKCLVEVGGETMLDRLVMQLKEVGVERILVNTHHLANAVSSHIAWSSWRDQAAIVYEPELLGTLGTLKANADFFARDGGWILHADNYIPNGLVGLAESFQTRPVGVWGSLLAFHCDQPRNYGVATVDERGLLTGFFEKVLEPPTNLASAASLVLDASGIDFVKTLPDNLTDISRDLLPLLCNRISVNVTSDTIIDVGTPEGLAAARRASDSGTGDLHLQE